MSQMLLVISIENTTTALGVYDEDRLRLRASLATSRERSADEYAVLIASLLAMHRLPADEVRAAIIASVVRPLSATLGEAVRQLTGIQPLLVGPGVRSGLNIKTDIPSQVGADIVANAVGALALAESPLIVVDFGTATTLTAINEHGELCGVIICPGVRSSLDALSSHAADLPGIALESPRRLLGKNTIDAMTSGIVYGQAAMVDGLLDRIAATWNNKKPTVIATGAHAAAIVPWCRDQAAIRLEPDLTLAGLNRIYQLNDRLKT